MDFLAPNIGFSEAPPASVAAPSLPTAVVGMVGVTEWGPFVPTLCQDWPEWYATYGGFVSGYEAAIAAYLFFLNGGKYLHTQRTVHYTDVTNAASKTSTPAGATLTTTGAATQGVETSNAGPWIFSPGFHLDLEVDTVAEPVATFDATAGARTGVGGTFPTLFGGGETLELALDSGVTQTLIFAAGDQSLAEIVDKINVLLVGGYADENAGQLRITSDTKGTGSKVAIIGGTGRATLGLAIADTSGTSTAGVANIAAVSPAEFKAWVESVTSATVTINGDSTVSIRTPTVGAAGSIKVAAASTCDTIMGLDNALHEGTAAGPGNTATIAAKCDGARGNNLAMVVSAAADGVATSFNLAVTESGVVLKGESWTNLTMLSTSTNYAGTVLADAIKGSKYITFTDLLTGVPPANRPTNGTYALSGGADGLGSLADTDFVGSSVGLTGMYAFGAVPDLTVLMIPGRATSTVHNAMNVYCNVARNGSVFPVYGPPAARSATQMVTYQVTTAALYGLSANGAMYWPQIKISNPDTSVLTSDSDGNVTVAPDGAVCGMMARTDALKGGVHQAPAGPERGQLYGVVGLETEEANDINKRNLVYPVGVNPIMTEPGLPIHVDGNRCLNYVGTWGYVSERRGMVYIQNTLKKALSFLRHANINKAILRRAYRTTERFLNQECEAGAFMSQVPAEAFRIDFGQKLNTDASARNHKIYGYIAVRKAKSADWVVIEVGEHEGEFTVAPVAA